MAQAAKGSGAPPQLIVMSPHRPATNINANAVDIFAPWGTTPPAPSSFPQPSTVTQQSTGTSRSYKLGPAMQTKPDDRVSQFVDVGAGIEDLYTEYGFRSLEREAEALANQAQVQFQTSNVTSFPSQYSMIEAPAPMPTMVSAPSNQMIEESLAAQTPIPVAALAPRPEAKKDRTLLFLILGAIGVGALVAGMRGK